MSIFDAVILAVTLILAIKGFFNGFLKEIAGLIGIVGGLYLASIYFNQAGIYINKYLFEIKNPSAVDLVGFIAVFVGFWVLAVFTGFLLGKILKMSALGVLDRIFGFIFAGAKFFILVSIIVALLIKIEFIRQKITPMVKKSVIYPFMVKLGDDIISINPKKIKNSIKNVKIPIK